MMIGRLTIFFSLLLLFAACHEYETPGTTGNGGGIALNFSVRAMEMEQADDETAITRSGKKPDETKIKTLYLVQFDGNAETSTVVKSGSINLSVIDSTAIFDFVAVDATCRVYVVANFDPTVVNGMTLKVFEKSMAAYVASTTVDASVGLPMCGYLDFNPATMNNIPLFTLRALVAKLTVTYTIDPAALADFKPGTTVTSLDVVLMNVPNGTSFGTPAATGVASRPSGVTFADVAVGKTGATYTYYVPENIAGNSSANITYWGDRSLANAPAGSLFFVIIGRNKTDDKWIVITSFIGDPAEPNTFNIYRNHAYTLTATIRNANTLDERIAVITDLNDELNNKTANCYLITDNVRKHYVFSATVRGNGYESTTDANVSGINYATLPDLSTAMEARVIWQTGINASTLVIDPTSVRLKGGKVFFTTTGKMNEGNAVIGLFASDAVDAPCLWSWHIWKVNGPLVPDVDCVKNPSPATASPYFKMMPLNLGAFNNIQGNIGSIGLFYQWGRKDPFPGPAGFNSVEPSNIYGSYNNGGAIGTWNGAYSINTSSVNEVIGTEAWAVKYPTAYITQPNSPYDWMSVRNDNLWGTPWVATGSVGGYNGNQGTKSIYDPCPVGYRVPPNDFANEVIADTWTNGLNLGGIVSSGTFWFPAGGWRRYDSAELYEVDIYGCYWSSSIGIVGSFLSGYLTFSNVTLNPQGNYFRVTGLSVRCVKE